MPKNILAAGGLTVEFPRDDGPFVAVDGIGFSLREGETLGIAGESGSGKTAALRAILGLLPASARVSGSLCYSPGDSPPIELLSAGEERMRLIRGSEIAMVFQNPSQAFDPLISVGAQIAEALRARGGVGRREASDEATRLLGAVGVAAPERRSRQHPHEFSGGMLQRAMMAMALAGRPRLLLADEPTSGLDATTQAQILDLVRGLREERGMSMIWITHDLGLLAGLADRVLVMRAGRIVEEAATETLFNAPSHPYTKSLIEASDPRVALAAIRGGKEAKWTIAS